MSGESTLDSSPLLFGKLKFFVTEWVAVAYGFSFSECGVSVDRRLDLKVWSRYGHRSSAGDVLRMTKSFKKEREVAAAEAEATHIEFGNKTLQDFLNNPDYEAKVGGECAAYLAHLTIHCKDRIPELVSLFSSAQLSNPTWFEDLSLDLPSPSTNDSEVADVVEGGNEEDAEPPNDSRPPLA
ncbi:hypothetical protein LIER_13306 [Lithospermum erythrorhizon]|uniref:Uncharacterized protein n=1 Tax=Lithospermum erythrorhizon TaxID=34254 RepID=A0AAV3PUZ3_LITER